MLTIIAIDKNLICELDDFEFLLSSVADKGDYKICSWNRDGTDLFESIPALYDRNFVTEGELRLWNILLVSDNRNCFENNPFGGNYEDKSTLPDPQLNEAAKMLGITPADSHSHYELPDSKYSSVKWYVDVNKQLKKEKLKQYQFSEFPRPKKIYLMSVIKKYDVDVDEFKADSADKENCYFNFASKAKYPSNCRFFKFNLSSNSNKTTKEDYFRLWMTILSFAYNDGADAVYLSPDTLYNIDTEIDKKVVEKQIVAIYSQVHFVKKYTKSSIENIQKARSYIESKHYDTPEIDSDIKVIFKQEDQKLFLNKKRFGLASNCPCEDTTEYAAQRETIEKRIAGYLKAPKRAVKKAVIETKDKGRYLPSDEEKIHLTEEQAEDLDEKLEEIELRIMGEDSVDASYDKRNSAQREKTDREAYNVMEKRSTVFAIVIGSLVSFGAVSVGFIPYIVNACVTENSETITDSILILLISILILAVAGFITLLVLKTPLSRVLKKFNAVVKKLVSDTNLQMEKYSNYLSLLAAFMKGNSFKTYLACDKNVYMQEEESKFALNYAYCEKRERLCQSWADAFHFALTYNEKNIDKFFGIDDTPEKNPVYSFITSQGEVGILYNGKKHNLRAPYDFISSLNITTEENV